MVVDNEKVYQSVQKAVTNHGAAREEMIPILNEINSELGYLPPNALIEVGKLLKTPASKVRAVASFYSMLTIEKRGRHVIQFCESAPCHVVGGRQVWQALQDHLQLKPGETSPDNKWTLITVSCLGVCGVGPVIVIDDEMFGNVKPNQVPEILAKFQ